MLFMYCSILRLSELIMMLWILSFYFEPNYMYFDNFCAGISPGVGLCCIATVSAHVFNRPFHHTIDLLFRCGGILMFIILSSLCLCPLFIEKYRKELTERQEWSLVMTADAYTLRLVSGSLSGVLAGIFLFDFMCGYFFLKSEPDEIALTDIY